MLFADGTELAGWVGTLTAILLALGAFLGTVYGLFKQFKDDKLNRQVRAEAATIGQWREYAEAQRLRAERAEKARAVDGKECDEKIDRLQTRLTRQEGMIGAMRSALEVRGIKIDYPGGTDTHDPLPPEGADL
jgi:uncharacterized protein HemX